VVVGSALVEALAAAGPPERSGWCASWRRRHGSARMTIPQLVGFYGRAVRRHRLLLAVLIADPRWVDQLPVVVLLTAAAVALRGMVCRWEVQLSHADGLAALAAACCGACPRQRSRCRGDPDHRLGWHRKPSMRP